jgi:hypothetical protein
VLPGAGRAEAYARCLREAHTLATSLAAQPAKAPRELAGEFRELQFFAL